MDTNTKKLWYIWTIFAIAMCLLQASTIDVLPSLMQDEAQITDYGRLALDPLSGWSVTWWVAGNKPLFLWSYLGPLFAELGYQIGGPSGGCITEQNLDIEIDYESLIKVGAMMGSGGLVVMDEDTCMVDVAKFFMDFIQRESCGKCIPCREGTRRMLEILEMITHKPTNDSRHEPLERIKAVMQLEKLGGVIKETALCGLGQTAPNPVLSTLKWFRNEYEDHIYDRKCSAGVCTELRTFKITVDNCTGCTVCAKKCPTKAIIGAKKTPHFIVEDKCIACGACTDACKFNAIEII